MNTLNDISYIKKVNQISIIKKIEEIGAASCTDLAETLKLSITSVSKNAKQLIEKNILIEKGEAESSGGRRPMLYILNTRYRFIIGVDFSSEVIRIALVDMSGNILELRSLSRMEKKINMQTIERVKDEINEMLIENNVINEQISVIVIGMQGIVNEVTGDVVTLNWFEDMKWIDIRRVFKEEYETEVIIKNDINLAAIGECYYGSGREMQDLIMINVDAGLGSGIIINRKIYTGSRFAAGEIAAFITNIDSVGKAEFSEFLENKISISAIVDRIKDDVKKGIAGEYWSKYSDDLRKINFSTFLVSFMEKNSYSQKIVDEIAKYLSLVIINMILILDIEVVVLGGEIAKIGTPLKSLINDYIKMTLPSPSSISIKVIFSEVGEIVGICGSIIIGREYMYEHLFDK